MTSSIEKRQNSQKQDLLEKLKETPIIEFACRKVGIARATFYRWKLSDAKFSKEVKLAIEAGSALINDIAESQLLAAIKDQNMTAIIFWLRSHHPSYSQKVEVDAKLKLDKENLTPEQEALVKNALKLAGLISAPESREGGIEG